MIKNIIKKLIQSDEIKLYFNNQFEFSYLIENYSDFNYSFKFKSYDFIKTENYKYYILSNKIFVPICKIKSINKQNKIKQNIVCRTYTILNNNIITDIINFKLFSNIELKKLKQYKFKYQKIKLFKISQNILENFINSKFLNFKEIYNNLKFTNLNYTKEIFQKNNNNKFKYSKNKNLITIYLQLGYSKIYNNSELLTSGISCIALNFSNTEWNKLVKKNTNINFNYQKILINEINFNKMKNLF